MVEIMIDFSPEQADALTTALERIIDEGLISNVVNNPDEAGAIEQIIESLIGQIDESLEDPAAAEDETAAAATIPA